VGRCRMGWGMERVSPFQPTRGVGERRELPQRGSGQSPGRKRILAILKATGTERSFLYLYDKNLTGQFALASPYSKFWGTCPSRSPRDLRPCVAPQERSCRNEVLLPRQCHHYVACMLSAQHNLDISASGAT